MLLIKISVRFLQDEQVPEAKQIAGGKRRLSDGHAGHECRFYATSHGRKTSVIFYSL